MKSDTNIENNFRDCVSWRTVVSHYLTVVIWAISPRLPVSLCFLCVDRGIMLLMGIFTCLE